MTKKTLYITEKASQVKNLKAALDAEGIENYHIEPLSGHITELLPPEDYKDGPKGSWLEMSLSNNFPFKPKQSVREIKKDEKSKKLYSNIKKSLKDCGDIVLACDADNEGVVLSMSVLSLLKATKRVRGMINMTKMDLDSLRKEVHIEDKIPYQKMYMAGSARSVIDWFFIQLTIQGTVSFRPIMQSEKNHVVHIGGVKSPTIKLVVDRDMEIENHEKTHHWSVKAKVEYQGKKFDVNILKNGSTKIEDEESALDLKEQLKELVVSSFKEESKETGAPKPHTLTSLQSEANKRYSIKAKQTLSLAQELYDKKFMSYPRTDSSFYGEDDYNNADKYLGVISSFKSPVYKEVIDGLPRPLLKRPNVFNDKKLEEYSHTALSGTSERPTGFSSKDSMNIYLLVQHRYLMQFMENYKYGQRDVEGTTNLKSVTFKSSSKETVSEGWKSLESRLVGKEFKKEVFSIPVLSKGDTLNVLEVTVEKIESKPKPRYTDATLLEAMENIWKALEKPESWSAEEFKNIKSSKMSLGTVATRASILESLVKSGYFKYSKKSLISTEKARKIVAHLPEMLTSPILRANLEKDLQAIVNKDMSAKKVVDDSFEFISKSIDEIKKISNEKMSHIKIVAPPSSAKKLKLKCPVCESTMLNTKKLYRCEATGAYDGKTKKWSGDCDFTLLKSSKKHGKLTQKDLKTLLEQGKVFVKDKPLILDLNKKPFFIK